METPNHVEGSNTPKKRGARSWETVKNGHGVMLSYYRISS